MVNVIWHLTDYEVILKSTGTLIKQKPKTVIAK